MACTRQLRIKIHARRSSNGLCEPASDKNRKKQKKRKEKRKKKKGLKGVPTGTAPNFVFANKMLKEIVTKLRPKNESV